MLDIIINLITSRRWRRRRLGISYSRYPAVGTAREYGSDRDDSVRTQTWHLARTRVQNVPAGGGCVQRHGNGAGLPIACATERTEGAAAEFFECIASIMRRGGWELQGEFECAFCEMGQSGRIECGGWFANSLLLSTAHSGQEIISFPVVPLALLLPQPTCTPNHVI